MYVLTYRHNDYVRCMHLKIEFRSWSVVWHHLLPLMNSFNKTETAIFPCRLCFLGAFYAFSVYINNIVLLTISNQHMTFRYHFFLKKTDHKTIKMNYLYTIMNTGDSFGQVKFFQCFYKHTYYKN